jgi:hypothetical protein
MRAFQFARRLLIDLEVNEVSLHQRLSESLFGGVEEGVLDAISTTCNPLLKHPPSGIFRTTPHSSSLHASAEAG